MTIEIIDLDAVSNHVVEILRFNREASELHQSRLVSGEPVQEILDFSYQPGRFAHASGVTLGNIDSGSGAGLVLPESASRRSVVDVGSHRTTAGFVQIEHDRQYEREWAGTAPADVQLFVHGYLAQRPAQVANACALKRDRLPPGVVLDGAALPRRDRLDGHATEGPDRISPLGGFVIIDLQVADFELLPNGSLRIVLINNGTALPSVDGWLLSISVGVHKRTAFWLDELGAGALAESGAIVILDGLARLAADPNETSDERWVTVSLTHAGADDSCPGSNLRSYSLVPVVRETPSLVLERAFVGADSRVVLVASNIGSRVMPERHRQVLIARGGRVEFNELVLFPPISGRVHVVLPYVARGPSWCRILVPALDSEFDNTRDEIEVYLAPGREALVGPGPTLPRAYERAIEDFSENLVWRSVSGAEAAPGARTYREWTLRERFDLRTALRTILGGGLPPPTTRPPRDERGAVTDEASWRAYVGHVAHSLWLEVEHLVPWTLRDLPPEELLAIFDSGLVVGPTDLEGGNRFLRAPGPGGVFAWNPSCAYTLMRRHELIGRHHADTIEAILHWGSSHLVHMIRGRDESEYDANLRMWGESREPPSIDRILFPDRRHHRVHWTAACQGTAGLICALLRSVNVPAQVVPSPGMRAGHLGVRFPSIVSTLRHGDDVYTRGMGPGWLLRRPTLSGILWSDDDVRDVLLDGALETECNALGGCNTVDEQRDVEVARRFWAVMLDGGSAALWEAFLGPSGITEVVRLLNAVGSDSHFPPVRAFDTPPVFAEIRRVLGEFPLMSTYLARVRRFNAWLPSEDPPR